MNEQIGCSRRTAQKRYASADPVGWQMLKKQKTNCSFGRLLLLPA